MRAPPQQNSRRELTQDNSRRLPPPEGGRYLEPGNGLRGQDSQADLENRATNIQGRVQNDPNRGRNEERENMNVKCPNPLFSRKTFCAQLVSYRCIYRNHQLSPPRLRNKPTETYRVANLYVIKGHGPNAKPIPQPQHSATAGDKHGQFLAVPPGAEQNPPRRQCGRPDLVDLEEIAKGDIQFTPIHPGADDRSHQKPVMGSAR